MICLECHSKIKAGEDYTELPGKTFLCENCTDDVLDRKLATDGEGQGTRKSDEVNQQEW